MEIFLFIMTVTILSFYGTRVTVSVLKPAHKPKEIKPVAKPIPLSDAGEVLMKLNDSLESIHRNPNLRKSLAALDVKYGSSAVSGHFFSGRPYLDSRDAFTWDCRCVKPYSGRTYMYTKDIDAKTHMMKANRDAPDVCQKFPEYMILRDEMMAVAEATRKQKHAAALSNVRHDLDEVTNLVEHYRTEAKIVTQVTEELYSD